MIYTIHGFTAGAFTICVFFGYMCNKYDTTIAIFINLRDTLLTIHACNPSTRLFALKGTEILFVAVEIQCCLQI